MEATEPSNGHARDIALWIIAVSVAAVVLYLGREVFIPVTLALVFYSLLLPVVRRLNRLRVPTKLAAVLVVLGVVGALVGGGILLSDPVQSWAREAPKTITTGRAKLQGVLSSVSRVTSVAGAGQPPQQKQGEPPGSLGTAGGSPVGGFLFRAFGTTAGLVAGVVEVLLLVYFLLAYSDLFKTKLDRVLHRPMAKHTTRRVLDQVESVVSGYVLVSALINAGQALVVGLALWLVGMPNPLLWGILTFVLEFVPYLGAVVLIVTLLLVGLASFQTVGHALLPPAVYLLITTLQNNLVSPIAYGRRLKLNPVAVLVGVMVWYFLWGIAGAFLAVPIIASLKVIADHVEGLEPVGEFLAD